MARDDTAEYLAPVRPGHHYAEARCTMNGATVGFAEVVLYRDEARTVAVARGTSTNKMRKPAAPASKL
jgi:acyl-coenzyme A thioesterase PaaI-like protein